MLIRRRNTSCNMAPPATFCVAELTRGSIMKKILKDIEGKILPPALLYMLGVPGGICVLLWFFIWRGK